MNEFEAAARSRKAYRLCRIAEHLIAEHPELTAEHFRAAEPELRTRIAALAKVKAPSDQTWDLMLGMLETRPGK